MMVAGGGIMSSSSSSSNIEQDPAKLRWFVLILSVIGVCSGLIIGYEIGIISGIVLMPKFLKENFPEGIVSAIEYCTFSSGIISWYTSSLYIAALLTCFYASLGLGHKFSIMFGGLCFLVGAVVCAVVTSNPSITAARHLIGFGFGCTIQSVPIYISETAHYNYRGALNLSFQMMIAIGIFVANLVNYVANNINSEWGWRIIFCLATVPAIIISSGSLVLPNIPNSMVAVGELEKVKHVLQRIRDINDIVKESNNLLAAIDAFKMVESPWRNIMEKKHRPHLVMAIAIPILQQLTGTNAIMFYAPILFKTFGFGSHASLMFAVITAGANVAATFLAILMANRLRSRVLLIAGGVIMFICQIIIGTLIWNKLGANNLVVAALICICVSSFAWSWGPLGWLVPSEVFPLEIRSAGERITVFVNMFCTFIMARYFLNMLCHFKFGLFYMFAFFALTMTIFAIFFMPEANGIPIQEMSKVWKQHWFWRRYIHPNDQDVNGLQIDLEKNLHNPQLASVTIA